MRVRTTKTASGSTAVQVVKYVKRKKVILKHIGSARDEVELAVLKQKASRRPLQITHLLLHYSFLIFKKIRIAEYLTKY